jgi:P27 family predicted phage terminase small subunit
MAGTSSSGRRPAPAGLRLLNGRAPGRDSGGRKVTLPPPFELVEDAAEFEPPEWLGDYAAEVWARSLPQLVRLKLTKDEDFAALAAYCLAVEQLRDATADIYRRGLIHEITKPGVRWIPRDDPAWNEDDARRQAPDDDPGEGELGYFAPWPIVERKANPAVAVRNAAMSQINALGSRFGLNPSAASALAGLDKPKGGAGADGQPNPFASTG